MNKKAGLRNAVRVLTSALALVAIGLLVRTFVTGWRELQRSDTEIRWGWWLVTLFFASTSMLWIAWRWRAVLLLCACEMSIRDVLATYLAGEIGKYVPGGIWPVVGRGELAVRRHAGPRPQVYRAVLLSLIYLVMAGLAVSTLAWGYAVFKGLPVRWWALVLLALPVGMVALHPRVAGTVQTVARPYSPSLADALQLPKLSVSVRMIATYVPTWLLVIAATVSAAKAVGVTSPVSELATAGTLPWIIGILAVPAPGGLGAREAVMGSVLKGSTTEGQAALLALASRLAYVVFDAVGAAIGLLYLRSSTTSPKKAD